MRIEIRKYALQLQHPFSISRETHITQDTMIVCLSHNEKTGYGESTSNPYYDITVESMRAEIGAVQNQIEAYDFDTPERFYSYLEKLGLQNFTLCALDLAAHDLYGKLLDKPLYEIWGTESSKYPITNYTIGIDTISKMVEKLNEKPWPVYKIKLGTPDDVAIVRELRKHTDSVFRIDANCAWTAAQTIANAPLLKELGVEFLEQPLKADDWVGMEKVKKESVLPVIADESCIEEGDVEKCSGFFDGINIKLTKCGGLTPALRMIKKGRDLGLKIMVGCMTESSVGISAIAQLLPQLDYVDMDGAMLLKEDIANGVIIKNNGEITFPTIAGSGVTL
ncbi:dipeptide epimerase [Flagellimonas myxillae]|uniref:dipeptide epimerase n=1 Tax=Flagellimonas myxillae TaxID=2942214 RepID=UPI00201EFEDD|nr:dipeptide epimerase [Muricauda myxillae]MCL6265467.1 dipeptide epimerase [Muricauda myxillae]